MRRRIRSVGLVVCMIAALLVPMTGAVAQVPSLGDVEIGNTSPHGGYSSATDFCLQCHSVHEAPGDGYALLLDTSISQLSRAFAAVALGGIADKELLPWNSKIAVNTNYRASVETLTNKTSGILDIL